MPMLIRNTASHKGLGSDVGSRVGVVIACWSIDNASVEDILAHIDS